MMMRTSAVLVVMVLAVFTGALVTESFHDRHHREDRCDCEDRHGGEDHHDCPICVAIKGLAAAAPAAPLCVAVAEEAPSYVAPSAELPVPPSPVPITGRPRSPPSAA
jgi:hypothetical protein